MHTSKSKPVPHYVTERAGGHGAVREFCDLLLVATGRYAQLARRLTAHDACGKRASCALVIRVVACAPCMGPRGLFAHCSHGLDGHEYYWLVRNTPTATQADLEAEPRHVPDYFMRDFSVRVY